MHAPFSLGPRDVVLHAVLCILQVALVRIEHSGEATAVVLALQLQHGGVDGGLEVGVLGVHHEANLDRRVGTVS